MSEAKLRYCEVLAINFDDEGFTLKIRSRQTGLTNLANFLGWYQDGADEIEITFADPDKPDDPGIILDDMDEEDERPTDTDSHT